MKLKVFISWSGDRSKRIAKELYKWVPRILQAIDPWMSEEDIRKGERWSEEVGQSLQDHSIGIICVTPENIKSEWLLFEAGALSKAVGESRVYPLLLGMNKEGLKGPLSIFQATVFEKGDLYKLLAGLNEMLGVHKVSKDILEETYKGSWSRIEKAVKKVLEDEFELNSSSLLSILDLFSASDLPKPSIESNAYFSDGFESYSLYEIVTTTAKKKLYNYSRMNRKLLDKEYWNFFDGLPKRIENGFDLKLLFLDPDAPNNIITTAHSDEDFREQLAKSIISAREVFSRFGIDHENHCRTYKSFRSVAMTIVDDAVLFAPVIKHSNGIAKKLTKSCFNLVHLKSNTGAHLINDFLLEWQNGDKLKNY